MDEGEKEIQERLTRIIQQFCKFLPNSGQVSTDLWKFARNHDRRSYQLIRFAMATDSDYRTVFKAIKEFRKRLDTTGNSSLLETLTPLLYWTSNIMYNRSHVPAIMSYAKSNENGLSAIAHDLLKDISSHSPEVLKAHVKEMCQSLQEDAPSGSKENSTDALDNLKACAAFAKRFPEEIPQDRKFTQAMVDFALHGSPAECAKHAVSIIMVSSAKKEMLARDLVKKCIEGSEYGKPGFLARLATLSQLCLLAPTQIDSNGDKVIDIAIEDHLTKNREPSQESRDAYHWSDTNDAECEAKCWAMKIVVNRVRSHPSKETLSEVSKPVYNLLHTLIEKEGELSTKGNTPASHKPRLRLLAARSLLKLSLSKDHEALITPLAFNKLAEVAQDSEFQVRASFLVRLKKYLGHNSIPSRFYTILFLLAFEPETRLKVETTKWIRSRAAFFAGLHSQANGDSKTATSRQTVLEGVFGRLLSLLAHHPDYGSEMEDLLEFSRYLVFYLTTVATAENASLIYHIAQRVKGCTDAVLLSSAPKEAKRDQIDEISSRLPIISDLATCTTRAIIEAHGWSLQTLPSMAKMQLPRSLFMEIKDHQKAMTISEKSFLPEGVVDTVENIVRNALRHHKSSASSSRKRKSDGGALDDGGTHKKVKKLPLRTTGEGDKLPKSAKKTPTRRKSREWDDAMDEDDYDEEPKKRSEAKPSRKSERTSMKGITYAEESDEEEEEAVMPEKVEVPEDDEDESEAAETILVVPPKGAANSKKKGQGSKSAIASSAKTTPSKPPSGRAQRSTRSMRE
jgi:sister-chromatid-cohesion protein PDS5